MDIADNVADAARVAIPLEQGLFFNALASQGIRPLTVAIPLEQGLFFNASYTLKQE